MLSTSIVKSEALRKIEGHKNSVHNCFSAISGNVASFHISLAGLLPYACFQLYCQAGLFKTSIELKGKPENGKQYWITQLAF